MHPPHTPSPKNTPKSISDLEKFTQDRAAGSLLSLDEFAKYWNDFDAIARILLENKLMNKAERDLYFWTGLPFTVRRSIAQQLTTTDLAFHDRLIPTWRDAIQAGRIVFHDPSLDSTKQSKDVDKLVRTLHGLGVDDANYAVAYARLLVAAPAVADRIEPPLRWTRSPALTVLSAPNSPAVTNRQTLRRAQSYVSYQWCPNCVEQYGVKRTSTT
ncbi:hypothetical protein Agabi119p4_1070 [Agaricus bisporus var. burnettii]|uniref:Uncharacterized protein n=1 Tax=Agaricus bisporus var. burnettii TaxID=192524 RepID=A0A8H7FBR7_AGABI|nr:hypothetical protein Agabi119p4_1070 [Agaricus bisporus var. burnettii]